MTAINHKHLMKEADKFLNYVAYLLETNGTTHGNVNRAPYHLHGLELHTNRILQGNITDRNAADTAAYAFLSWYTSGRRKAKPSKSWRPHA